MNKPNLCMLMILDGWGLNPGREGNAVVQARTPFLDSLAAEYPKTQLTCCGKEVGLPAGIMGNSEVGHLNIGAGRIVYQDLLRIDMAIGEGTFFDNAAFGQAMDGALKSGSALHLMGLVSDGGVHSQLTHIFALIEMAAAKGLSKVFVHAILDGRDTLPTNGVRYLRRLEEQMAKTGVGKIASVCGRYYAMDRDTRWERTELAHRLYTLGEGTVAENAVDATEAAYGLGMTDEFVKPIIIRQEDAPATVIEEGDAVIFFNFRADRARQITGALTDTGFAEFKREKNPAPADYVCMADYGSQFELPIAFASTAMAGLLGEAVSAAGLSQLRIAETEKYAHVTYFFNGGVETPFAGEDRSLIPSPRDVATYDLKPAMSAGAVTDEVIGRIRGKDYGLIVLNFANMDMVGHTGKMDAAITACETVDACVRKIAGEVLGKEGVLLITADHGNAEMLVDKAGNTMTSHTTNPVPLILAGTGERRALSLREGILGDIAPTILDLLGIEKPEQMTGRSLITTGE